MNIFASRYTKPGKGVDKDTKKKRGFFLYFEILFRKFVKLLSANVIFSLFSLPYIAIMFILLTKGYGGFFDAIFSETTLGNSDVKTAVFLANAFFTFVFLTLWGSGPASCGYAYIQRCFTREEHAWIFSDFWDYFKSNFKQSMIVVIIDFVVAVFLPNAIIEYSQMFAQTGNILNIVLVCFCTIILLVYTFMHFYIYQLMITFDNKLTDIYKNALILAFGKSPMNFFLTIVAVAIIFGVFSVMSIAFGSVLYITVFIGLAHFPIEFYSSRVIKKVSLELREERDGQSDGTI